MAVEPDVAVVALGHEAAPAAGNAAVGHDDHGLLARSVANELVGLAIVVAQQVDGHALGEGQPKPALGDHVVGKLDAKEAHTGGIALGEPEDHVERPLARKAHVGKVMGGLSAAPGAAGVDGQGKDDLEAKLLGPVQRVVDVLHAADEADGLRRAVAKGVPGDG